MKEWCKYYGVPLLALGIMLIGIIFPQAFTGLFAGNQTEVTIAGPQTAGLGELCVFALSEGTEVADWTIVPAADFYVDSSKRKIVFSSNKPNRYTIIAATVGKKNPVVLAHCCYYGSDLVPTPSPQPPVPTPPLPNPPPSPSPQPSDTLTDWVAQNIPPESISEKVALAELYSSTASAMDSGLIATVDAAISRIRTGTMTTINIGVWRGFLDELSNQIKTKMATASGDVKLLARLYRQIAVGLLQ